MVKEKLTGKVEVGKMIVVYCLDENYTPYTAKSIRSVRKFNSNAKIVIVTEKPMDLGFDDVEYFVIPLKREFRKRKPNDRITKAAYLKLFLPQLPYDKILYLDGDTICQGPLDELWEMPCEYINLCESHLHGKEQAMDLGVKQYGMTSVLLMNLDALRRINFTQLCLDVEQNYPTPPVTGWRHDETCINVAMNGKLSFIDQKWNYCRRREYENPIRESSAKILHFVGKQKEDMLYLPHYAQLDPILADIKGKRVAIVGNAKSIFDHRQGAQIDSFDFVIRFNRGFITQPESQGTKTNFLILACLLTNDEIGSYNANWVANRSNSYINPVYFTITNADRRYLRDMLDCQPSTGFMAIDLCLSAGAKSIDLFGFDFERTPTFYNPEGYQTKHNYSAEQDIVREYERCGLLTINPKTEQKMTNEIKFDSRNHRKHNAENKRLIKKSLEECGAGRSILIDGEDEIIAGNGVYEQAKKLKMPVRIIETDGSEIVAIKRTDLKTDDEKRKQLAVMDNSTSDSSEFDLELMAEDFSVESLESMGVELPEGLLEAEPEVVEDEIPEQCETRCKLGDLWQLGNHRLICGDSTSQEVIERLMDGKKADIVFTDPPYGISVVGNNGTVGGGNVCKPSQYLKVKGDETTETAQNFYNTCVSLGLQKYIIWGGNYFIDFLPFSDSWVIWDKRGEMASNNFADGEMAWCSFHTPIRIYKQVWCGMIREGEHEKRVHPTQKPIRVLADILKDFTKENEIIFDGFGGSGSTLLACEQTNRKCLMIEYELYYCDVILQRYENFTGIKPVLLERKG